MSPSDALRACAAVCAGPERIGSQEWTIAS